jgi:uncharacterized membrane protein YsdA (DUF1294 family)
MLFLYVMAIILGSAFGLWTLIGLLFFLFDKSNAPMRWKRVLWPALIAVTCWVWVFTMGSGS